jgi:hypothetical protein
VLYFFSYRAACEPAFAPLGPQALCLGASAVLLGRPVLYGLALGGQVRTVPKPKAKPPCGAVRLPAFRRMRALACRTSHGRRAVCQHAKDVSSTASRPRSP